MITLVNLSPGPVRTFVIAPRTPASRCSPLTAILVTFGFLVLQPSTMGASRTGCLPDAVLDAGQIAHTNCSVLVKPCSLTALREGTLTFVQVRERALWRRLEEGQRLVGRL